MYTVVPLILVRSSTNRIEKGLSGLCTLRYSVQGNAILLIEDCKAAECINVLIGLVFTFEDNEHTRALKIHKVFTLAAVKQKQLQF